MWTVTEYLLNLCLLSAYTGGGSSACIGPLEGVYVGLFTSPTPPLTQKTNLAGITEAAYDGYARQLVQWYPPFISFSGPYLLEGRSLIFTPTDSTNPQSITGVFLADAPTGGHYLAGLMLSPNNVPLTGPSQSMVVDAEFSLPFSPIYGGPDVKN
jgi:hypothetical protein